MSLELSSVVLHHVQGYSLPAVCKIGYLTALVPIAGYCAGDGTRQLFGMAMGVFSSLMSWMLSIMAGVFHFWQNKTDPNGIMVLRIQDLNLQEVA